MYLKEQVFLQEILLVIVAVFNHLNEDFLRHHDNEQHRLVNEEWEF